MNYTFKERFIMNEQKKVNQTLDLCNKALTYLYNLPKEYLYHNLEHTKMVVNTITKLFDGHNIDYHLLKIAAYYHDTGYSIQSLNHEEIGCKIAADDMVTFGFNDSEIYQVQSIIMATKIIFIKNANNEQIMYQFPGNDLFRKTICDADFYNFGSPMFFKISLDLKKELFFVTNKDYSDEEWFNFQIKLLQNHSWHTNQAKVLFDPQKQINLNLLLNKVKKLE